MIRGTWKLGSPKSVPAGSGSTEAHSIDSCATPCRHHLSPRQNPRTDRAPARCSGPCAECCGARATLEAPECRARCWQAHNRSRDAACGDQQHQARGTPGRRPTEGAGPACADARLVQMGVSVARRRLEGRPALLASGKRYSGRC
jgi:hypothetical protein